MHFRHALLLSCCLLLSASASDRATFAGVFAPGEGIVRPQERPFRDEVCLNGTWQFQPVAVPASFRRDQGTPPELPPPAADGWSAVPIKIPSPWNVNTWGCGRDVGAGTAHPYWPDSVYFPSYPAEWDRAEMGWLRRTFTVPAAWKNRRIVLHFEAVAGEAVVCVNGREAGRHFEAYLPFELDVTDLVRRDATNELLVGVRARSLFTLQSARYAKMRFPFPTGSETERLAGIWQDVFLLGLPAVRVAEVFVRPRVDADTLELHATLRNETTSARTVTVGGEVQPWINEAGRDVLDAPVPRWSLGPSVLALPSTTATLAPGATTDLVLQVQTTGRLKTWSPDAPNLYAAVLSLDAEGRAADRAFTRFGWRQFALRGNELLLNGSPIRLTGDFLHPFSPAILSRRHVWAWYRMIRDFGGNSVRPHAQPHPRHFLELADEMGLVVLDESAIFGSSIALNFDAPEAWTRFADHVDGLILRDRNHPSVVGWSFGNELFAIFEHNNVTPDVSADWYARLRELGRRAERLDPTRPWISCDGDEDLRGTLPVWSRHFGHGTPLDRLPAAPAKPLMVGESGGTYYARPAQLATFNGARAFEDYAGRNEALAIDLFDNLTRLAPKLAYYSASETAWFGIEHLNYGYRDFSRLPGRDDGVFFTRPFAEGEPGLQPERLPPFTGTLNPGWDPALPLYRPLAMFEAQKAALSGAREIPWKKQPSSAPSVPTGTVERAAFVGDRAGVAFRRMSALGVAFVEEGQPAPVTILDGLAGAAAVRAAFAQAPSGSTLLVLLGAREAGEWTDALPAPLTLTERDATQLVPDPAHPFSASLTAADLYFAEDGADRFIQRRGLSGPLVDGGRVVLRASETDWSLFNEAPEKAKCAAVVLYEKLQKPAGAALVERTFDGKRLLLCALDHRIATRPAAALWRRILAGAGLQLGEASGGGPAAFDDQNALVNALIAGRFSASSIEEALATDFIGESAARPAAGARAGAKAWKPVASPSRDRFVFQDAKLDGSTSTAFAVYAACWLRSPRALDDLLAGGPDVPRFALFAYAGDRCRLFVNGREQTASRTDPADYRTRYAFENIPLAKGWNRIVFKVASTRLDGPEPATLAVRMTANDPAFLRHLESATEAPREAAP